MSTTDNDSARSGTQQNAAPGRLSLPSFASVRDNSGRSESQAESSTSGSRWSVGDRQSRSPSAFRVRPSIDDSDGEKQAQTPSNNSQRRNREQNSGGFLLEPTTHSSRLSRALLSRSDKDRKGKRKSDVADINLPKRRNRQSVLDQESSVKSSPLSTELRHEDGNTDASFGSAQKARGQFNYQHGLTGTPDSQRSATPSAGLDNDSTQIVQMALKLSEGRRRQASGRRIVTGQAPLNRTISGTSSHQLRTPTKNLDQHITTSNAHSGTPLADSPMTNDKGGDVNDSMTVDDSLYSPSRIGRTAFADHIEFSRGTLVRVEKAKAYLELAYEHRRLLPHLPPIRGPANRYGFGEKETDSKSYNPLQYVRNRKLRLREKNSIDAEAEGWHDVEKVRAWVDAVVSSHSETKHDPLECVRLPPLSLKEEGEDDTQERLNSSPTSPKHTRPRRPKSDWMTHPGDLIADACWLEQGLNKTKIHDRDNNPIYPPNTTFRFSGWRNFTPVQIPEGLQQPSPSPSPSPEPISPESAARPLSAAPELPTFRSASKKNKDVFNKSKEAKLKRRVTKERSDSKKRVKAMMMNSSDSGSSSDASSTKSKEGVLRGRKKGPRKFNLPDGDPFVQPITHLNDDYAMNGVLKSSDPNLAGYGSKRPSVENSRLVNYIKRNGHFKSSSQDRGRSRGGTKKHHLFSYSKDFSGENHHGQSSTEEDSLSPGSPVHHGLPSIAINLDAPVSRSPSPTKKSKSSLLRSFKDKSKTMDNEKIDTTDFAQGHERSHSRNTSVDVVADRNSSNDTSRGTSPFTRGTSPFAKLQREATPKEEPLPSGLDKNPKTMNRQNSRPISFPAQDQPSRIRAVFKGGRIAELVGTEVSRVGDFIWKREVPPAYRHQMSGSDASFHTYEASDTDEDVQNGYLHSPSFHDSISQNSNRPSLDRNRSQDMPKGNDKPQLHNPNLPSFTSPFQRDRERQEKNKDLLTPGGFGDHGDHISRQVAHHRDRSKSPRLDRLAPPKLDTSSYVTAEDLERKKSYGFGDAINRSQSASRAFNEAIKTGSEKNTSARSSSAGISSNAKKLADEAEQTAKANRVEDRDLARVRSFLLISAVKAKNISAYYEQGSSRSFKVSQDAKISEHATKTTSQQYQLRRRDEHVITARNLISQLAEQSTRINDRLHSFSNDTIVELHKQIQDVEDQIENSLTPRVRAAADNAGELSVKLTTTSTQAVQSLQDVIGEAFRLRRRGPFRWMRLLGFTLMEWAVVGLLWFIWAIVTIIRVILGLFRVSARAVRWLLWID